MAKKSLILDNGDGRVALSNTSSVSLDDGAGSNMSASYMTASSLSLSGIGVGQVKILSASNGAFSSAFPNGTVPGGAKERSPLTCCHCKGIWLRVFKREVCHY